MEDQSFRINGFNLKSNTFLFLFLICAVFSGLGIGLLIAIPSILICYYFIYPGLYQGITRLLIKISNKKIVKLLSIFPNIEFRGEWFQQMRGRKKEISSLGDIWFFIKSNIIELTIIHLIFLITGLRFGLIFQGGGPNPQRIFFGLAPGTILVASFFLPIFTGFYFIIIWSIEDAGLKLYKLIETKDAKSRDFEGLFELSDSFRTLSGALFGVPSLFWLVDYGSNTSINQLGELPIFLNILLFVLILYLLTIGVTIFVLILFYRSKRYEQMVNELRIWIGKSSMDYYPHQTSTVRAPPVGTVSPKISQDEKAIPQADLIQKPMDGEFNDEPTSKSQNFCIKCGFKLKPENKFCTSCGRRL